MNRETPSADITDLVWPATRGAEAMRLAGVGAISIGALVLLAGLVPGMVLPRPGGVDLAFVACALVVGGLLVTAYGAQRAKTRRLRLDRAARTVDHSARAGDGAWKSNFTVPFDAISSIAVETRDVDDAKDSHSLILTRQDGERHDLWPVTLATRADADDALSVVMGAIGRER
jgi:hypothetical protein